MLRRSFSSRNIDLWRKLYVTYVRLLIEFAVPVWAPYLEADIKTLESIQRRATKIPFERFINTPTYEERCKIMNLQPLSARRMRGDIIQWYKIEKGLEKVNWISPPGVVEGRCG